MAHTVAAAEVEPDAHAARRPRHNRVDHLDVAFEQLLPVIAARFQRATDLLVTELGN
jgi:hypothetical protein